MFWTPHMYLDKLIHADTHTINEYTYTHGNSEIFFKKTIAKNTHKNISTKIVKYLKT